MAESQKDLLIEQLAKANKTVELIQSQASFDEQMRRAMMSSQLETILLLKMQLDSTNEQLKNKQELLKTCDERLRECMQSLKESEEQKRIADQKVTWLTNQLEVLQVQERATQETLQTLKQQMEDSLRTVHTENEHLALLHSRAESDLGQKNQEIMHLQEQIKQMIIQQKQMKTELIEAADIITEKEKEEEGLGPVPMEEEQEELYFNPIYSQMPPSAPNASNKTIFNMHSRFQEQMWNRQSHLIIN